VDRPFISQKKNNGKEKIGGEKTKGTSTGLKGKKIGRTRGGSEFGIEGRVGIPKEPKVSSNSKPPPGNRRGKMGAFGGGTVTKEE